MQLAEIKKRLKNAANPKSVEGMARVGISPDKAFGVRIPDLRAMAKEIGRNHDLAARLWRDGMRETMILATMIDEPAKVDKAQMEAWVTDFYDWEVCDQCIANLFEKTPFAASKAVEWSNRSEEFVKRAGFVLMARLAVSDKKAPDSMFVPFFDLIERDSIDERNFVKKAVNWALRQIGKRNLNMNEAAVKCARRIQQVDNKAAKWIAADALKELTGDAVLNRLKDREKKSGSKT